MLGVLKRTYGSHSCILSVAAAILFCRISRISENSRRRLSILGKQQRSAHFAVLSGMQRSVYKSTVRTRLCIAER